MVRGWAHDRISDPGPCSQNTLSGDGPSPALNRCNSPAPRRRAPEADEMSQTSALDAYLETPASEPCTSASEGTGDGDVHASVSDSLTTTAGHTPEASDRGSATPVHASPAVQAPARPLPLTPFAGGIDDDFDRWLRRFNLAYEQFLRGNYEDDERDFVAAVFLSQNLSGDALDIFASLSHKVQDGLELLVDALTEWFPGRTEAERMSAAIGSLADLSQGPHETVDDYIQRARLIHRQLDKKWPDNVIQRMTENLYDTSLRHAAKSAIITSRALHGPLKFEPIARLISETAQEWGSNSGQSSQGLLTYGISY